MAYSLTKKWILEDTRKLLKKNGILKRSPKTVQVIASHEAQSRLIVSDSAHKIDTYLTEDCKNTFCETEQRSLSSLKNVLISIDSWHFYTDAMCRTKVNDNQQRPGPIVLLIHSIHLVNDSTRQYQNPVPVMNERVIRDSLKGFNHKELLRAVQKTQKLQLIDLRGNMIKYSKRHESTVPWDQFEEIEPQEAEISTETQIELMTQECTDDALIFSQDIEIGSDFEFAHFTETSSNNTPKTKSLHSTSKNSTPISQPLAVSPPGKCPRHQKTQDIDNKAKKQNERRGTSSEQMIVNIQSQTQHTPTNVPLNSGNIQTYQPPGLTQIEDDNSEEFDLSVSAEEKQSTPLRRSIHESKKAIDHFTASQKHAKECSERITSKGDTLHPDNTQAIQRIVNAAVPQNAEGKNGVTHQRNNTNTLSLSSEESKDSNCSIIKRKENTHHSDDPSPKLRTQPLFTPPSITKSSTDTSKSEMESKEAGSENALVKKSQNAVINSSVYENKRKNGRKKAMSTQQRKTDKLSDILFISTTEKNGKKRRKIVKRGYDAHPMIAEYLDYLQNNYG